MDKRKTRTMDMDTQKVLILLFLFLFFCKGEKKEEILQEHKIEEKIKKVKITEFRGKEKSFELLCDEIINKKDFVRVKNILLYIYEDNRLSSFLSADSGDYYDKVNMIKIYSNIKLWNREGDTLWTDFLYYDEKKGILSSNSPCKLFDNGKIIIGEGFESKKPFNKIRILGKTKIIEERK